MYATPVHWFDRTAFPSDKVGPVATNISSYFIVRKVKPTLRGGKWGSAVQNKTTK
jgi:hypothetical protein